MNLFFENKRKTFLSLMFIFVFFGSLVFAVQYFHEKNFKTQVLNNELNKYTDIINNYLQNFDHSQQIYFSDSLKFLFTNNEIRISIIDFEGKVLYDSQYKDFSKMENHLFRKEIQEAFYNNFGTDIRNSQTTHIRFYYFAKKYNHFFIRISKILDSELKTFIEPEKFYLLSIFAVFFLTSVVFLFLSTKFTESISILKNFVQQVFNGETIDKKIQFPNTELGIIGSQIIKIYEHLKNIQDELTSEKEKLIRHLNNLGEGIAIFSKNRNVISVNHHFIQYVNHISDRLLVSATQIFEMENFAAISQFIDFHLQNNFFQTPTFQIQIQKNGKIFNVKGIVFQDKSFEISIDDVTKPAKRKILKQQLTENIAHELKTPVTSIKGFLETLLNNSLSADKQIDFTRRAFAQACRLSNLIHDISILTKIEEASHLYFVEKIILNEVIKNVVNDVALELEEHQIFCECNLKNSMEIDGNFVLLYSIFRNLLDNAIIYAGDGSKILISQYFEDDNFVYISFSDTGKGVPEKDLSRLFERFYRVEKGRGRNSGGTGLGLAIVKNAVLFHKGDISVKNRSEGGLEFLFSLSKNLPKHYEEV